MTHSPPRSPSLPQRAFLGLALGLGLLAVAPPLAAADLLLFNGQNLEGWRGYLADHTVGLEDVWSVRDGVLVCKGSPMGYLYTTQSFKNFRLEVEWRWAPGGKPGNSGVLLRINGKPMALPRCLETQLKSGDAGDLYGFHGMKLAGDAPRSITVKAHELGGDLCGLRKLEGAEKEAGQWNRCEITLDGGTLQVRVNGKLVNQAKECEVASGPVALQSEGGEIHFRTVRLTPLPD